MIRVLLRLLQSWWSVDRIRVSPHEGEWLRLAPGSIIELEELSWVVHEREIIASANDSLVAYRCTAGSRSGRLLVVPGRPDDPEHLYWDEGGLVRPVESIDLVLWDRQET
jgi:hypothetical protein